MADDAILAAIETSAWRCRSCDRLHHGLFDLVPTAPWHWDNDDAIEENGALRMTGDFLSEDFCVMGGEHFFIRGITPIPVHGLAEPFAFGTWSTLSRDNFERYVDGFDDDGEDAEEPWLGWFSTDPKPFEHCVGEKCAVFTQADRQRPLIQLLDEQHPLSRAQIDGIDLPRLLGIYRANGHEFGGLSG